MIPRQFQPFHRDTSQQVERVVQAIDAALADRFSISWGPTLGQTRVYFRARLRAEINMMLIQLPERDY